MICPVCHAENRDKAKFCDECGAKLASSVTLPEIDIAGLTVPAQGQPSAEECSYAEPETSEAFADVSFSARKERSREEGDCVDGADNSSFDTGIAATAKEHAADSHSQDSDSFDFEPIEDDPRDTQADAGSTGTLSHDALCASPEETAVIAQADHAAESQDEREIDGLDVPVSIWRTGTTMEMPRVDASTPASQPSGYRAPEIPKKKKARGKLVAGLIIVVLLAAGTAAAITYNMELWGGIKIPNVDGMTKVDATAALEEKGFSVRAMDVRSDDTEGLVLMSDPEAGSRAEAGSEIVIHVAVARTIPEVVGKQQNEALSALAHVGYDQVTVKTEKSNEAEGTVISVSPDVGTKAKAGTPITLTVAVPYTVPDVIGSTFDDAKAALETEGYVVEVSRVYTENTQENTVISTDPVAGTKLKSGETITVYVAKSRASELVEATRGYLYAGAQVQVGGTNYEVQSLDSVEYAGNNTTKFSMTAKPFTWFLGETIYLSARTVSGSIVWADDNTVVSVS